MVKEQQRQADRLALLADYQVIVVASEHMADEYQKYDLPAQVKVVSYPISLKETARAITRGQSPNREWRLLFLGRMETLKGGDVFLEALPQVQAELGKSLNVTFAGDGPKREAWQRRAAQLSENHAGLKFDFPGWVTAQQRGGLFQNCDLIVVPSLWPEPFGLVGLEAGQYGVPAVAFAVGGVVSWLQDGINGKLANPEQPYETSLARAIVHCLKDEKVRQRLMSGAAEQAGHFSLSEHFEKLLPVLAGAVKHQTHAHSFIPEVVQYQ
jgi:glycosyltransferase involved in cell wall biosynthesis